MRFTSLAVELLRARPALVFWAAVAAQATLWFAVPVVFYSSPPGDVAQVLAVGREYQIGSAFGPPLAFWLADIAFRLAGNHMFGVYLLSQLCLVVTFWALFALGRTIVGAQHSILAVLLALTVTAFGFPGVEFGPAVLARPLWALVLMHYWQAVGQGRRNAWFAFSIEAGLLLLTSYAGALLFALLALFTLATRRGRRALASTDPWMALVVIAVLLGPHLLWFWRDGADLVPALPSSEAALTNLARWPAMTGLIALMLAGMLLLLAFNSGRIGARAPDTPIVLRSPVDPLARLFVYVFAFVPLPLATLLSVFFGFDRVIGDAGLWLMLVGLAVVTMAGDAIRLRQQHVLRTIWAMILAVPAAVVVVLVLADPWTSGAELKTSLPAEAMGRFFAESFQRRIGQPLPAVAGDPLLAPVIAVAAPGRPRLFFDAQPERSPWIDMNAFREKGGLVVWRATDTAGQPPEDIRRRFPDIVPEVPRAFERLVQGRRPLLRIGWAIIRPTPKTTAMAR